MAASITRADYAQLQQIVTRFGELADDEFGYKSAQEYLLAITDSVEEK